MAEKMVVIYWDSSALLSFLFKNGYSEKILEMARHKGVHLLTTLAIAEAYTIISHIQRHELLSEVLVESLFDMLEKGFWSRLNVVPDSKALKELACKWPLEGSGLWHLATAKTLQREFPELMLLTVDKKLARASKGERIKLCMAINNRDL
jgi:predicted nucleic acid-binding protein